MNETTALEIELASAKSELRELRRDFKLAGKAIRSMMRHNKRQADLIAWLASNHSCVYRPKWVVKALHEMLGTDRRQTKMAKGAGNNTG